MYRSCAKNCPRHRQGTGILAKIFKLDHTVLQNPCQIAMLLSLYEPKNSEGSLDIKLKRQWIDRSIIPLTGAKQYPFQRSHKKGKKS